MSKLKYVSHFTFRNSLKFPSDRLLSFLLSSVTIYLRKQHNLSFSAFIRRELEEHQRSSSSSIKLIGLDSCVKFKLLGFFLSFGQPQYKSYELMNLLDPKHLSCRLYMRILYVFGQSSYCCLNMSHHVSSLLTQNWYLALSRRMPSPGYFEHWRDLISSSQFKMEYTTICEIASKEIWSNHNTKKSSANPVPCRSDRCHPSWLRSNLTGVCISLPRLTPNMIFVIKAKNHSCN